MQILIPGKLLNLQLTFIANDCNHDFDNDHCIIQCDNTSPPTSILNSFTSFIVSFAPLTLEKAFLPSDHNLVHSAHCSVTNSGSSSLLNFKCSYVSVLDFTFVSSWLPSYAYVLNTIT